MSGFLRLLNQKRNPPKPATESFAGRTILVTGATGGLGLEAAKKLAALNVSKLIITARSEEKGEVAKRQVEEFLRQTTNKGDDAGGPSTEIIPMVLDLNSFAKVREFVDTVKSQFQTIDGAVLNAGTLQAKYEQSPDGWEESLQVNALSTFLLGVLLLPLLIAAADQGQTGYKPHLTFVSSGTVLSIQPEKMEVFVESETPLEDLSAQKHFPPGALGGSTQYARSKLILEYAVRHLAVLPSLRGPDGQPKVIINTACPGMCKSDLGRQVVTNVVVKAISWIFNTIFARSAEQGANTFTTALTQGVQTHGQMWKNDRVYDPPPMCVSEAGRRLGDKVWSEVVQIMVKADPSIKLLLA